MSFTDYNIKDFEGKNYFFVEIYEQKAVVERNLPPDKYSSYCPITNRDVSSRKGKSFHLVYGKTFSKKNLEKFVIFLNIAQRVFNREQKSSRFNVDIDDLKKEFFRRNGRNNRQTGKRLEREKDFNPLYQRTDNEIIVQEDDDQENINWDTENEENNVKDENNNDDKVVEKDKDDGINDENNIYDFENVTGIQDNEEIVRQRKIFNLVHEIIERFQRFKNLEKQIFLQIQVQNNDALDLTMSQKKCLIEWDKKDFNGDFFYNYGKWHHEEKEEIYLTVLKQNPSCPLVRIEKTPHAVFAIGAPLRNRFFEIGFIFSSIQLPIYVQLWIIDYLPEMWRAIHSKKIHLLESIMNSQKAVFVRRQEKHKKANKD